MKRLILSSLVLAAAGPAGAEELNLAVTSTAQPTIVSARTGLDHAFVAELGYRRVLSWRERPLVVGADVELPWAEPDLGDHRLRLVIGAPLLGDQAWKLSGWIGPAARGSEDAASRMEALGVDAHVTGGYYVRRWFAAAELGIDWVATTHVSLTDAYREHVFEDAQSGWYSTPGGTLYGGLQAGLSFRSFDVVLRAGQTRTLALDAQTIPLYVTLGVNVRAW